jgi:DNA-binding LacI/PurR family transcriptional regulator
VHCVADDGFEGAVMAVRYLVGLGHHRIGFLIGDRLVTEARDREAGIRTALFEAGQGELAKTLLMTRRVKPALEEEGRVAALELLSAADRPSALFCAAGDLVAAGAYAAAKQLGLRIPQDLSVLGYDDLPLAAALEPPLSTLHQPLEAMGATLAGHLIRAAAANIPAQAHVELVKPRLELRQSCAAPDQMG